MIYLGPKVPYIQKPSVMAKAHFVAFTSEREGYWDVVKNRVDGRTGIFHTAIVEAYLSLLP